MKKTTKTQARVARPKVTRRPRATAVKVAPSAQDIVRSEFPTNWLDPLLTGPNCVIGHSGPWGCPDIERLVIAIQNRVLQALSKAGVR